MKRCEICGVREAKRRYAGFDICKVDYNLALRLVKKMRTVTKDGCEEIVNEATPDEAIQEVMKRRLELAKSNKWSGNRKTLVQGPCITILGGKNNG